MHCEQAEMLIPQYIFNELTAEDAAQIAAHLTTCASCTQSCKELKEASSFLESALKAPNEKKFSEEKRQHILAAFSELKPIVEPIELAEAKKEIKQKPSFDFKTFFVSIAAIFLVLVGLAGIVPMMRYEGTTRSDGDRNVVFSIVTSNEEIEEAIDRPTRNRINNPADSAKPSSEGVIRRNESLNSKNSFMKGGKEKEYSPESGAHGGRYYFSQSVKDEANGNAEPMIKSVGDSSLSSDVKVLGNSGLNYAISKVLEDAKQNELGNRALGSNDKVEDMEIIGIGGGTKPSQENLHTTKITNDSGGIYSPVTGKSSRNLKTPPEKPKAKWGEKPNNTPNSPKASSQNQENEPLGEVVNVVTSDPAEEGEVAAKPMRASEIIIPEEDSRWRPGDDESNGKESWYKTYPGNQAGLKAQSFGEVDINDVSKYDFTKQKGDKQLVENIKIDREFEKDSDVDRSGVVITRKKGLAPDLKQLEEGEYYIGPEITAGKEFKQKHQEKYGNVHGQYPNYPEYIENEKAEKIPIQIQRNDLIEKENDQYFKITKKGKKGDSSTTVLTGDAILQGGTKTAVTAQTKDALENFPKVDFADDDYFDGAASFDEGYIQKTESKTSKEKKSELAPLSNDQLGGVSIWKDKKNIESQKDKEIEVLKAELATLQEKSNVDSEVIDKLKRLAGNEQSSEFSVAKETENKFDEQTAQGTEVVISDTPQVGAELMGNIGGGGGTSGIRSGGGKKKAAKSGAQILEEMNQKNDPSSETAKPRASERKVPILGDIPLKGELFRSNKPKPEEAKSSADSKNRGREGKKSGEFKEKKLEEKPLKDSEISKKNKEIDSLKAEIASMQQQGSVDSARIDQIKRLVGKEIDQKVTNSDGVVAEELGSTYNWVKEEKQKTIKQVRESLAQDISKAHADNESNNQSRVTIENGVVVVEELGNNKKETVSGAGYLSDVRKLDDYDIRGLTTKQNEVSKNKAVKEKSSENSKGEYVIPFQSTVVYPEDWNKLANIPETKMNTYSVLDLVEAPKDFAGPDIAPDGKVSVAESKKQVLTKKVSEDNLKELIKHKIARDTWDEAKGTSIEVFQGKLIVNHTEEVQKQVEAFLEELKQKAAITEAEQAQEEVVDVVPVKPEPKKIVVNPFVNTSADALSTFSIDTDSASYYVCRQSLLSGVMPHESVVRPEEFINAFDYNYCLTGQKTFAINTDCMQNPFNSSTHILKVGIKGKVLGRDGRKPVHVVLVVDTSGSMAKESRLPMVKKGIEKLVTNMQPGDRVSLVTYGSDVTLNLEYTPVEDIDQIQNAVESLKTGGSTDLAKGVMVGYQIAATHFKKGAMNQVMICSDGVANVGHLEADKIIKKVEAYKKQGVSFTSIGFGSGDYNDQLLQKLALRGDGFYYYVNNEEDVKRVFEKEIGASFNVIAKDVKLQVAFKENRVLRYRLIGYEAREVKDKDFRNNAVDGGEIISGKSVTAIYELELAKAESGKEFQESLGTVTVRFQNVENNQWEEDAVAITGKIQMVASPKENPYFYLAYCAATFAEIMRKSPYVNPNAIGQIEDCVRRVSEELVLNDQVKDLLKSIQAYEKLMVKDK